ncbi:protein cordon-bleu-like isoform X1 [Xyrichtys novacula]|uniref:Protein cordon-bleu-like isoform X1 n=1 Tax=Xyrichtys novacula TaxID=13765 RepID=A0AAV1HP39_XYRNO|nr:protein cordon-bleu-like isoform X1 [Xyrichtys novacula]
MPAVCEKCEFQVETTILLRNSQSKEPLDLTKSLNEHGVREVFAKDTATERQHQSKTPEIAVTAVTPTEVITPPPPEDLPKKEKKQKEQKENSGFLSLFRKKKKKPQMEGSKSAPSSPGLRVGVSANVQSVSSSSTLTVDMPKKRRAPQPPLSGAQNTSNNLSTCNIRGAQRSAESTLRSTKRRAPPPPCANNHQELELHTDAKGTLDSLHPLADLRESDDSGSITLSFSSSSSPKPSRSRSSSSFSLSCFHEVADHLPSFRGKDLSDARSALAKILTSSVSKGGLVKRLRSSASTNLHTSSSCLSVPHRRSENGTACAEVEPVLPPVPPAEPEWEDPIERRVMTTFRVVPSKKEWTTDAEITLKVPEQIRIEETPKTEASMEIWKDQIEAKEDPCCLDGSKTETSLLSPDQSSQEASSEPDLTLYPPDLDRNLDRESPSLPKVGDTVEREEEKALGALCEVVQAAEKEPEDLLEVVQAAEEEEPEDLLEVVQAKEELPSKGQGDSEDESEHLQSLKRESVESNTDHCDSNTHEKDTEDEGEDCFPPPPPPVFYNEDLEEKRDATAASSPPLNPTSNGQIKAFSGEHQNRPNAAEQTPTEDINTAPSRFAQAVALAVQRSRNQGNGRGLGPPSPGGPHNPLPSSPRSIYQYGA